MHSKCKSLDGNNTCQELFSTEMTRISSASGATYTILSNGTVTSNVDSNSTSDSVTVPAIQPSPPPPSPSGDVAVPPPRSPPPPQSPPPPPLPLPPSTTWSPNAPESGRKHSATRLVPILVSIPCALMVIALLLVFLWRRKGRSDDEEESPNLKPLSFDRHTLKVATNHFADSNKLGEGGFGPVYKGVLPDGQQVAVKRLSTRSHQGLAELRNEIQIIAQLQHKNLVRMLGYCWAQEKLLVYEYLPNTSLDKILFNDQRRGELNWERRYKIIQGIASGLAYLHDESRIKVIHRDLKPGNILLDQHMNPKISDFGLSKLHDADLSKACASRLVGTNGYIAPEYASNRHISPKSDVYSYGMLALEVITGRSIKDFKESPLYSKLQTYIEHRRNLYINHNGADSQRRGELNWERRYKIIQGIASGLAYLHHESRIRVIHRDLKPGNILLDQHMNPKISDFGLSKLHDADLSKACASRLVGTHGYIAPEYACNRYISTKSDVYSYGMLALVVITGRSINHFNESAHYSNLQSDAWKNWRKGEPLVIVDANLGQQYNKEEALRCIHIALLCIQANPSRRPSMLLVMHMLNSCSMTKPNPQAPAFLVEECESSGTHYPSATGNHSNLLGTGAGDNQGEGTTLTVNEVTTSIIGPRQ